MNSWHLKYFIEAAQKQSLQAASQRYHVTPSAVSQAIRTLEVELDIELLVHQKRNFALTPAGQAFLVKAIGLITEIDRMGDELRATTNEPRGLVRIAAPRSLLTEQLSNRILQLRKKYPHLRFQIRSGIAAEVKKLVRDGEVDLGILVEDVTPGSFSEKVLFEGDFVLFTKTGRRAGGSESLVVTNSEKPEVQHLFREFKRKKLTTPELELEVMSWTMIEKLVRGSELMGYAPDYILKSGLSDRSLKIVDLGLKSFRYQAKVIWPLAKQTPVLVKLLLEV